MENRIYNVLFLCTGNSARSVLAEAILNRMGAGRFRAYSAGSQPKGEVHPMTLKVLERAGYDVSFARSKSWDEFDRPDAPVMDFVFTVCDSAANEACPVWPGHPMSAHWGIPDPAAVSGTPIMVERAFVEAYTMLERRISLFVNLPLASIERTSLRHQLDAIGQIDDGARTPDVA